MDRALLSHSVCSFVCVCVWEREREREGRGRKGDLLIPCIRVGTIFMYIN